MENIIPYLSHTSFCVFTTETGFIALQGSPGGLPGKGWGGLNMHELFKSLSFFKLNKIAYRFPFKGL
jgi:hypothetical protein